MSEDGVKKIIRDTQFFEPKRFQPFNKDIQDMRFKVNPEQVTEINLKCSGYGYFQEEDGSMKIQSKMKENFISYLKDAVGQCFNLKTLKVQFNGFNNDDGKGGKTLSKIIRVIEDLTKKRDERPKEKKKTAMYDAIWLHSRMLKGCEAETVRQVLNITDELVKGSVEEISIQMSGWEFKGNPMSYQQLEQIFHNFAQNLVIIGTSPLKRLKLDISSWYTHNSQAYNFLSEAESIERIAESIESTRPDNAKKDKRAEQLRKSIKDYLKGIDKKYNIQNPIPGKHNIILSREGEYKKRIYRFIQDKIRPNMSGDERKNLLKILDDEWGGHYKEDVKRIKQKVDDEIEKQQDKEKEDQKEVEHINKLEKEINDNFIKFPFDHVMALRVKAFHLLIINFMRKVQEELQKLDEIEIDLRNWNTLFQMNELKKLLDKQFAQEGVMRLLSNAFSKVIPRGSQIAFNQQEGATNKLRCTFLM